MSENNDYTNIGGVNEIPDRDAGDLQHLKTMKFDDLQKASGSKHDSIQDAAIDEDGFLKGIIKTITQNQKPMLQKILSLRNFVNLKDEDGNFSWEELAASVLQIVIAGAIVWGAQQLGLPLDKIISAITGG